MRTQKKVLTTQLPAVPVTEEMRGAIIERAEQQGKSISHVVRDAITFFLLTDVSISNNDVSISIAKESGHGE